MGGDASGDRPVEFLQDGLNSGADAFVEIKNHRVTVRRWLP